MYYHSKWLFFVVFYAAAGILYHLIDKQVILQGFMSNFVLGATAVFVLIISSMWALAFVITAIIKLLYLLTCRICKLQKKDIVPKTFWIIFTGSSFAAAFAVFLKVIQY